MSKVDSGKRALWQERLERFEASGLSVSEFCRNEEVSTNTFYYWAKRLRPASRRGRRGDSAHCSSAPAGQTPAERAAPAMAVIDSPRSVRIAWGSGLQVSVPTDCLEAIRCVLDWAGRGRSETGAARSGFQQVLLAK